MQISRGRMIACCSALLVGMFLVPALIAQSGAQSGAQPDSPESAEQSAEEERARKINDRFLALLKRTPRFGTALDRVYGFHVERGTLDEFAASLQQAAKADQTGKEGGVHWMILGLVELQRGRDADAVKAFREAERLRPDDPLASYYLGRSLVLVGETDDAAAAFERAIDRQPQKADLLEIFQALGRIHQRSQRTEEALKVWDRLERLFPDDLRVQEQIATILADEGDHEQALKRFEALAEKATDRYRKVQYALQAGELKIELGRTEEAIADFEKQLAGLKPDSWLHRDVRGRIEDVFLRSDDYAGLVAYYEKWLGRHPDDLDAMTRIAEALAFNGRSEEARAWYEKALKRAPSDRRLRRALIDQLIREDKFAEAIEQYEELDRIDPNNPDNIEQWGLLILEDKSRPEAERKQAAAQVWRKLIENRPDDAVIASQVADLFRSAKMTDEAITLYQKAIELAPRDPQYREYLGEYYHMLERSEDAVATWKAIAAGEQRTRQNLVRLAEVFDGFGYDAEALQTMEAACEMDPEFADRVRFARMLRDAKRFEDSLGQLASAGEMAESPEETQLVLEERIKTYQSSGELAEKTETLGAELAAGTNATAPRWRTLALYYEASGRLADAAKAVDESLKTEPESVPGWTIAARLYEMSGRIGEAAEANRKLADLDRRYRTEYLKQIATLEMRLGRLDEALQAGREVIATAPGNPEHYQFFANLCFQLGQPETGLDALRRSVRVNPSDLQSLLSLASALGEQFRTAEAIELYWRAFEKADDLDGQIGVIGNLTELYLRTNHFDRLISRLENRGRELNRERDMTLCLAAAYRAAGDLGMARDSLEQLLTEDSRDPQLLTQLSQLAEQESDYEAAVSYQRRINAITATDDGRNRLAMLLLKTGEISEAEAIWERLANSQSDPGRVLESVDNLIGHARYETAQSLLDRLLRQNPADWESLFRSGVIDWKQDEKERAEATFRALLALDIPQDTPSAEAKRLQSRRQSRSSSTSAAYLNAPTIQRSQATYQTIELLGLNSRYYASSPSRTWMPGDFGQARVAALAALASAAESRNEADQFFAEVKQRAEAAVETDPVPVWDWYYLAQYRVRMTGGYSEAFQAAQLLARRPEVAAQFTFLISLPTRYLTSGVLSRDAERAAEPLDEQQLDAMLNAYEIVSTQQPTWLTSYYAHLTQVILSELRRAERDDKAQELYESCLKNADNPQAISLAIRLAASRGDTDAVLELIERQDRQPAAQSGTASSRQDRNYGYALITLAHKRSVRGDWPQVFQFVDFYLRDQSEAYAAVPASRRSRSASAGANQNYVYLRDESGDTTYKQLDYPQADEYFNWSDINFLYNIFDLCQRNEQLDALIEHLAERRESTNGTEAVFLDLGLSHLSWWADDKARSILYLSQAARKLPGDVSLRMQLASLFQQNGRVEDALALVDSVEPSDHNDLRQREIMALQLAVLTGNIDRARQAARRLFGLRLDTGTQIQLSAQMHQLGMHEMAEGVLARTRRQAGNQSSTLIALMQQYQSQGNADVAVQIAHQILRRTTPSQSSRYRDENSMAREQALQVLVRSGRLEELIERAAEQIERSPGSVRLHEILADYYKAAGKTKEAQEVLAKIAKLQPDDASSLYQLARQLEQSGDTDGACDMYLKALRQDPSVLSNDFYQVERTFERGKRMEELADVLCEIDLRKIRDYHYVLNVAETLMREDSQRDKGLKLFQKLWEAHPDRRAYLVGNINNEAIWKLPVMFEYAREGIIPQSKAAVGDGWQGIADSLSYYGGGRVEGTVNRLLRGLNTERLNSFTKDVHEALEAYPKWHGGRLLLCALDAKAGRHDAAADRLQALLDDEDFVIPDRQGWAIGLALQGKEPRLDKVVIRLYEDLVKGPSDGGSLDQFQYTPARNLVRLYAEHGQRRRARDLMYKLIGKYDPEQRNRSNPGYGDYEMLRSLHSAGEAMLALGFPLDAMRVLGQADEDLYRGAARWSGNNDSYRAQIRTIRKKAEDALTPQVLIQGLDDWLPAAAPKTVDGEPPPAVAAKPTTDEAAARPLIDLAVEVRADDISQAAVQSLFADLLMRVGQTGEGAAGEISQRLDRLVEMHPDDLSVRVAAAASALSRKDEAAAKKHLAVLQRLANETAAADAPPKGALALWIIAREAVKVDALKEAGGQLADTAFAAVQQSGDEPALLALLRERGEIELAQGNRKAAEEHWSHMLDVILARPEAAADSQSGGPEQQALEQARDALLNPQPTEK